MSEKIINVPIEETALKRLGARADRNGRATCREAQRIITEAVNGKAVKA